MKLLRHQIDETLLKTMYSMALITHLNLWCKDPKEKQRSVVGIVKLFRMHLLILYTYLQHIVSLGF